MRCVIYESLWETKVYGSVEKYICLSIWCNMKSLQVRSLMNILMTKPPMVRGFEWKLNKVVDTFSVYGQWLKKCDSINCVIHTPV